MSDVWPPGPENPVLGELDVHVWLAPLDAAPERLAQYEALLAEDERERAARFRFDKHRNRYIVGRGILRELLGRYLGEEAQALKFSYSEYGKPELASSELQFNLAHSGKLALFSFCAAAAVGVDIESVRPLTDAMAIAERFFSPAEREALRALPQEEQTAAFFRCWSRKEAFIKAVGEGLSFPLDAFDVSLAPGEEARLRAVRGSSAEAQKWSLFDLGLQTGYAGTLAVRSAAALLSKWRYRP
jgi:4'-phosphopantetheinyl transferase